MKNELQFQSAIIKLIRKEGGYARKLAHKFHVGIPDLLLMHPSQLTTLAECKFFRNTKPKFNRMTGITNRQIHELEAINKAHPGCGILMVGFDLDKTTYIASTSRCDLMPRYERGQEGWLETPLDGEHIWRHLTN